MYQYIVYTLFVLLTAIATFGLYHLIEKDVIAFHQGEVYFNQKKYQESIEAYRKAISLGFKGDRILRKMGDAYLIIGDFSQAASFYKAFLKQHPNDKDVRLSLARVLSYQGQYDESVKEYKQMMESNHD